jgi:hypothetical protein
MVVSDPTWCSVDEAIAWIMSHAGGLSRAEAIGALSAACISGAVVARGSRSRAYGNETFSTLPRITIERSVVPSGVWLGGQSVVKGMAGWAIGEWKELLLHRGQLRERWPSLRSKTPRAATEGKRRGPSDGIFRRVLQQMRQDVESGRFTLKDLTDMKQVALADEYGVSRQTVLKALETLKGEQAVAISISDK